jgi:hypothetical protein
VIATDISSGANAIELDRALGWAWTLSVSGAVIFILDLSDPLNSLVRMSSDPLRQASSAHLNRMGLETLGCFVVVPNRSIVGLILFGCSLCAPLFLYC